MLAHRSSDCERDVKSLAAAAVAAASDGSGTQIVEADGYADMGFGRTDAVGGIESHPTEIGDQHFGPSVAGVLRSGDVGTGKIARDVASRQTEMTGGRDVDVGQILAHAAAHAE